MKFAYDRAVKHCTEEYQIIIQDELDDLQNWNNRNGMKFKSTKGKVMFLGTNNKNFCCKVGTH